MLGLGLGGSYKWGWELGRVGWDLEGRRGLQERGGLEKRIPYRFGILKNLWGNMKILRFENLTVCKLTKQEY